MTGTGVLRLMVVPSLQNAQLTVDTEAARGVEKARRLLAGHNANLERIAQISDELTGLGIDIAKSPAGQGDDERAEMLRRVQNLYNGVLGLIQAAHEEKNPNRFLKGIAEARRCLALLAKVVGVLNEPVAAPVAAVVNVNIEELQAVILTALVSHPQARVDVAAALVRYDDERAGGDA